VLVERSWTAVVVGATTGSRDGHSVHVSSYSVAPTSNNSRFVSGAFQVVCAKMLGATCWYRAASGGMLPAIPRWHVQRCCSSTNIVTLFLGVACQVSRRFSLRYHVSFFAGRLVSASYANPTG